MKNEIIEDLGKVLAQSENGQIILSDSGISVPFCESIIYCCVE